VVQLGGEEVDVDIINIIVAGCEFMSELTQTPGEGVAVAPAETDTPSGSW
jgi:hypothetical protein